MSCRWQVTPHGQWEISQSNPPSELPEDPIISTSSNPDERSSPATRRSRSASAHQMDDSLFSHAAQAETEPIPRDGDVPDPQDMLIPDSPTFPTLPSDFDDHIQRLQPEQTEAIEPSKSQSQTVRRREVTDAPRPDPSDSEFEILESDDNESDSDYVAEMTNRRRGKKKPPSKTVRGKAASKQQVAPKRAVQNASVTTRISKTTAAKDRPQKSEAASKTTSRRTKQLANAASARHPTANTSTASVAKSVRTSGRTQGNNTAKKDNQQNTVIPDSQILPAERRVGLKHVTARVPKTSFFAESQKSASVQPMQHTNATKTQLSPEEKTGNEQSSSSRNNGPHASSIVVDGDDMSYPPDSPKEHDHSTLPEAHTSNQASPVVLAAVVGPNSKKKRSPLESKPKSSNAKKSTTRTYGQKVTSKLGSSDLFRGSEDEEIECGTRPSPAESQHAMDQKLTSFNQDVKPILEEINHLNHTEEQIDKAIETKATRSKTLEKPARNVTKPSLDRQPSLDVAPAPLPDISISKYLKPDVQAAIKKPLSAFAPISNVTDDETKHTAIQSLPARAKPRGPGESSINHVRQSHTTVGSSGKVQVESFSDSHQAAAVQLAPELEEGKSKSNSSPDKRVDTSSTGPSTQPSAQQPPVSEFQRDPDNFDTYVDPPQDILTPTEKQQPPKGPHNYPKLDMAPMQINSRSRVNDLGSPSRVFNTATETIATLGRSPPQELHQLSIQEEQTIIPARIQASLNRSLPWRPQTTSDSEPQLVRADSPLPTSYAKRPQARNIETSKTTEDRAKRQPESNPTARIVLSPSSSVRHSAEHTIELPPQAPRLDPRSIDFAHRVAREQKKVDHVNQDVEEEVFSGGRDYKSAKRPLWLQPEVSRKPNDNPKLPPLKADKPGHIFWEGQSSRGRDSQPSNRASKPEYEAKWQDAVDAASGGVIDTLHFISTNLLEHLRTREQSVFAVVNEYKRNGTKVSEKLAKRQAGEWLSASTTVEEKCLELTALYGGLSKKTQDFRAKCLSKHRSQAYAEWQRQTARIKGAIRTAREEALLG